jgi:hypothetical protein
LLKIPYSSTNPKPYNPEFFKDLLKVVVAEELFLEGPEGPDGMGN